MRGLVKLKTEKDIVRLIAEAAGAQVRYRCGDGLYLFVRPSGHASWVAQYRFGGQSLWATLGTTEFVSIEAARAKHAELRLSISKDIDPRGTVLAAVARPTGKTFEEALTEYLAAKSLTWVASNRDRETNHHKLIFGKIPAFTALPLSAIDQTAKNAAIATWQPGVRNHRDAGIYIDAIIKFAETGKLHGKPRAEVKHHSAMLYRDVPTFYARLAVLDQSVAGAALRFLILTGARSDEVIGGRAKAPATWGEIVLVDGALTWVIPGSRMKAGREHRVPLSAAALALLGERQADDIALFKVVNDSQLRIALKASDGNGFTVHGFRATFRTWIAKATTFGDDLGELCLAHDKRSAVEKAYQRSDLLEKRREVMSAWAKFIGLR